MSDWAHIDIGPLTIHAYGAMYSLGAISVFLLTWLRYKKIYRAELLLDIVFWVMLFGVIGGRLFYVLVYNFDYYLTNPLDSLAVWKGGMSIHGGVLGGILGLLIASKKNKVTFWTMADAFAPAVFLGLMFGRLGNWINGELMGTPSALPWAVDFGDGVLRHPWPLYAALAHFLACFVLIGIQKIRSLPTGAMTALFFFVWGLNRFVLEFWRAADPAQPGQFLTLSIGQWLALIPLFLGVGLFAWAIKQSSSKRL